MSECVQCGKPFLKKVSRHVTCSLDCRRLRFNAYMREKRAGGMYRESRLRQQARRTERYRNDPEYRAHIKARHGALYHAKRDAGKSVFKVAPKEVYDDLLERQAGLCAICARPETAKDPTGRIKRLAIDHDRETGAIRGLLCGRCNTALGLLGHEPSRIEAASEYMRRHL